MLRRACAILEILVGLCLLVVGVGIPVLSVMTFPPAVGMDLLIALGVGLLMLGLGVSLIVAGIRRLRPPLGSFIHATSPSAWSEVSQGRGEGAERERAGT